MFALLLCFAGARAVILYAVANTSAVAGVLGSAADFAPFYDHGTNMSQWTFELNQSADNTLHLWSHLLVGTYPDRFTANAIAVAQPAPGSVLAAVVGNAAFAEYTMSARVRLDSIYPFSDNNLGMNLILLARTYPSLSADITASVFTGIRPDKFYDSSIQATFPVSVARALRPIDPDYWCARLDRCGAGDCDCMLHNETAYIPYTSPGQVSDWMRVSLSTRLERLGDPTSPFYFTVSVHDDNGVFILTDTRGPWLPTATENLGFGFGSFESSMEIQDFVISAEQRVIDAAVPPTTTPATTTSTTPATTTSITSTTTTSTDPSPTVALSAPIVNITQITITRTQAVDVSPGVYLAGAGISVLVLCIGLALHAVWLRRRQHSKRQSKHVEMQGIVVSADFSEVTPRRRSHHSQTTLKLASTYDQLSLSEPNPYSSASSALRAPAYAPGPVTPSLAYGDTSLSAQPYDSVTSAMR